MKKKLKRTAKEAEKMIIAGLKEAVQIHQGKRKPVRQRTYTIERNQTVAEPVMKHPDRREKIRRTKATAWAKNTEHFVWAHVGTTRGDIYGIFRSKKRAEE